VRRVYAAVGSTEGTARSAEAERFPPGELVASMPLVSEIGSDGGYRKVPSYDEQNWDRLVESMPLVRRVQVTRGTAGYPRMTSRTGIGWSEYASLE
jgi:hypothetical protein